MCIVGGGVKWMLIIVCRIGLGRCAMATGRYARVCLGSVRVCANGTGVSPAKKKRLIQSGVDPEQIRLLCLYLKNPKLERRWKRYRHYVDYELPRIIERRAKEPKQLLLF